MTTYTWIYSAAGLVMAAITLALFRLPSFGKYLEKADARFIAEATDNSQRQAAIERFSEARQRSCGLAILFTTCFCILFVWDFLYTPITFAVIGLIGTGFGAAMEWVKAAKYQADLRLLKVVDRLKQ